MLKPRNNCSKIINCPRNRLFRNSVLIISNHYLPFRVQANVLLCIFDLETAFSHLFYCLFQFFPHKYYKCLWISTGSDSMSCWCLILIKKFVSCAFIYFYIVLKTSILMQLYTCTCKTVISITILIDNKSKFL